MTNDKTLSKIKDDETGKMREITRSTSFVGEEWLNKMQRIPKAIKILIVFAMLLLVWLWFDRFQPPVGTYRYSDPEAGVSFEVPNGSIVVKDEESTLDVRRVSRDVREDRFLKYDVSDKDGKFILKIELYSKTNREATSKTTPNYVSACGQRGFFTKSEFRTGKLLIPHFKWHARLSSTSPDLRTDVDTSLNVKTYNPFNSSSTYEHTFFTVLNSLQCE